jgi:hypothetical protein
VLLGVSAYLGGVIVLNFARPLPKE